MNYDNVSRLNIETARGLTFSACDAFEVLQLIIEKNQNTLTVGMLAGHVIENSLKAHLALAGFSDQSLKALGHDLLKCWNATVITELNLNSAHPKWLIGINFSHKRIRYRYPKSYEHPWLPHPEDYMAELEYILIPLKNDFLLKGGRFVDEF